MKRALDIFDFLKKVVVPFVLAITYEERTVLMFAGFVHKENACFPMCYKGFYTINALFFFQLEFVFF